MAVGAYLDVYTESISGVCLGMNEMKFVILSRRCFVRAHASHCDVLVSHLPKEETGEIEADAIRRVITYIKDRDIYIAQIFSFIIA